MIYLTADLHLDHKNIIEFCNRPFTNVEEMNVTIIDNINSKVESNDVLYILGDFCFTQSLRFIDKIKVREKHLILGNHDQKGSQRKQGFSTMQDVLYLRYSGMRFFFSHYAHRTWRNSIHGAYHAYGHSHGTLPGIGRSMDVGVDALNFYPISIEDFVDRLKDKKLIDQHVP